MKNEQVKKAKFDLKKNSSIEVFVVSLIVVGLVGFFVILPQINAYFDSQRQLTKDEAQLKDLTATADQLQKIDLTTTNSELKSALLALPDHPDLTGAVNQIQRLISDNQLQLTNLTYAAASEDQTTSVNRSYDFKIDITGSLASLKNFITDLRSTPLLAQLTSIDATDDKPDANKAETNMSLSFYYLPPSAGSLPTLTKTTLTQEELDTMAKIEARVSTSSAVSSDSITGPRGKSNPFQ